MEQTVEQLKTEFRNLKTMVKALWELPQTLEQRVKDAEGRSKRSNFRILSFPEQAEG